MILFTHKELEEIHLAIISYREEFEKLMWDPDYTTDPDHELWQSVIDRCDNILEKIDKEG